MAGAVFWVPYWWSPKGFFIGTSVRGRGCLFRFGLPALGQKFYASVPLKGLLEFTNFRMARLVPMQSGAPLDTLATKEDLICLRFGMMNFEIRGLS